MCRHAWWEPFVAFQPLKYKDFPDVDNRLFRFMFADVTEMRVAHLGAAKRKHLHERAESLGLKTTSIRETRQEPGKKTVVATKPAGWALPEMPTFKCDYCGCEMESAEEVHQPEDRAGNATGKYCADCVDAVQEEDSLRERFPEDCMEGMDW